MSRELVRDSKVIQTPSQLAYDWHFQNSSQLAYTLIKAKSFYNFIIYTWQGCTLTGKFQAWSMEKMWVRHLQTLLDSHMVGGVLSHFHSHQTTSEYFISMVINNIKFLMIILISQGPLLLQYMQVLEYVIIRVCIYICMYAIGVEAALVNPFLGTNKTGVTEENLEAWW